MIEIDEENPDFSFDLKSIGISGNIIKFEEGIYLETEETMFPISRTSIGTDLKIKYHDPIDDELIEIQLRPDQYFAIMEIFDMIETNKSNDNRSTN